MKTEISMSDWMEIQHKVTRIDSWSICPKDASFSMAGITHTQYTDGKDIYESVMGNGFCAWYVYEGE